MQILIFAGSTRQDSYNRKLANAAATYIQGAVLNVDGGWLAR